MKIQLMIVSLVLLFVSITLKFTNDEVKNLKGAVTCENQGFGQRRSVIINKTNSYIILVCKGK